MMNEKNVDIKLTVDQVNLILNHLGRGTYNEVANVIDVIRNQVIPQISLQQQPAAEQEE